MKVGELNITQRVLISLLGPILIGLIGLGGYRFIVQATAETVKENSHKIERMDKDQAVLKSQIPEIQKSIDRVEDGMTEQRTDIKLILREIAKINGHPNL